MKKTMTILESLQHSKVNAEAIYRIWNDGTKVEIGWKGITPGGKQFYMERSNGYGLKFVLHIDGKTMATNALYRTVVKLIRTN